MRILPQPISPKDPLRNTSWFTNTFTTYNTFAIIKVKDYRLGLINLAAVFMILIYVAVYQLLYSRGYMKLESPTAGSVRVSARFNFNQFNSMDVLEYCQKQYRSPYNLGCKYVNLPTITDESSVLIPTRVNITVYDRVKKDCQPTSQTWLSTDPSCLVDLYGTPNVKFVNQSNFYNPFPEKYTFIVDHNIRGYLTKTTVGYMEMDGELVDVNGDIIKVFPKNGNTNDYIFDLETLLNASGASLDKMESKGKSFRYEGMVLLVVLEYVNPWWKPYATHYTMSSQMVPSSEYKLLQSHFIDLLNPENTSHPKLTLVNYHGVKVFFKQTGSIGTFNLSETLINIVAGLALLSLSGTVVELIMLNFMPEKGDYYDAKYRVVDRDGLRREEEEEEKITLREVSGSSVTLNHQK
ncbi:hypothetical protein CONCODRAFT_2148 [Conidiobolus coronatus NRRL 28638]|uniref:Uncharacterized protein n=1 Tax=Conidiobolus coronatus (strain ATCC 28846 / CBS 209.66 / NRRL 28638) TaxID=796925 RepID=A0A137PII8_CONC2|nr:hypothetical protein CONCODRAFT_2148 [Conidiobolus coronatus NRRL 28638]|eukprot:KXN74816.1 hypothetical protein CONCODRAFT_2148 [Conidiobolus coronatus NRRL 28638]